jgi:hypothetical protein
MTMKITMKMTITTTKFGLEGRGETGRDRKVA